ncbi:bifunctional DNA primase/polymerase famiily protein [Frankia torreyi]|uniref:Bifunctional DNA primase/polymerase famiily protein n=1 Tax=Frankia torreyi TaxID=1856 RepID=A0A0D8B8F2_9ACTN|nr:MULTISPECIES: bifunctional DNA primase/polymerase [Frankia]KJE20370.1 bifunctional DNA primase/polymerase famiily protein [Frankia torreyi]
MTASDLLGAAEEADAAGLCVLPVKANGTKAPDVATWTRYITARSTPDEHRRWFRGEQPGGIGVVYGPVSGNVEMIEFEGRAITEGILAEVDAVADASGLGEVWQAIRRGWVTESPSGGLHFRARIDGAPVPGNTKLARRLARADELTANERHRLAANPAAEIVRVLIETRGHGGYGVIEPSGGLVHATGRPYRRLTGSPATIPTIPAEQMQAIRNLCRMSDRIPKPETPKTAPRALRPLPEGELRPGDDFERVGWDQILGRAGWVHVAQHGRTGYWRRPGKDRGSSATTGRDPSRDRLFVFSTSTEFEAEVPYTKFGAYAVLFHSGDHTAAARDLATQGYGARRDAAPDPGRLAEFVANGGPASKVGGRLVWAARQVAGEPGRARLVIPLIRAAHNRGLSLDAAARAAARGLTPNDRSGQ